MRCKWCNLNNQKYIEYHDNEWCQPNFSDKYLLEMLLLESFQAGLSFECVLNKRENFKKAYDDFDLDKICNYDDKKINELLNDKGIIRNKRKIISSIQNSKIFKSIVEEYGSFYNYLKRFTKDKIIYENNKTTNIISDMISKDLKSRKMKFVGSVIIYSYLQSIGVIYSHEKNCFLYCSLIKNISKIHTTKMGYDRISKNLNLKCDVVKYLKNKILSKNCLIYKKGKNWYCEVNDIIITINSYSYTIITAHINKR